LKQVRLNKSFETDLFRRNRQNLRNINKMLFATARALHRHFRNAAISSSPTAPIRICYWLISSQRYRIGVAFYLQGVDGARVERILELSNIAVNKNTVPGDKSAIIPGGIRMGASRFCQSAFHVAGTPAMTTRGLKESDFETVAEFVDRAVAITLDIKKTVAGTKLKDFKDAVAEGDAFPQVAQLKRDVVDFSQSFPVIGFGLLFLFDI
jgi:hypothetical protein